MLACLCCPRWMSTCLVRLCVRSYMCNGTLPAVLATPSAPARMSDETRKEGIQYYTDTASTADEPTIPPQVRATTKGRVKKRSRSRSEAEVKGEAARMKRPILRTRYRCMRLMQSAFLTLLTERSSNQKSSSRPKESGPIQRFNTGIFELQKP